MTEIILGMPGPWAENYHEESDHYTAKIGGFPDWPIEEMDIDQNLLNCSLCGVRLCLVVQVYAPISMDKLTIEERVIYIFGCLISKCASDPLSWRAIRVQKCHEKQTNAPNEEAMALDNKSYSTSKSKNLYVDDLLSFADDIDENDDDVDLEELSRAFSDTGTKSSRSKQQNFSMHSKDARNGLALKAPTFNNGSNKPGVPCFYIYTQKIRPTSDVDNVCIGYSSLSMKKNEISMSDADENEKWEGESYEYDRALGADRTYLKFKKQLDLNPEQCFRYSYGGKPLLARPDLIEPNTCNICGSSRQYEMQLMSPLLYFLHQASKTLSTTYVPEEWSWMTLIIYTCSNSCCPLACKQTSSKCSWAVACSRRSCYCTRGINRLWHTKTAINLIP